MCQRRDRFDTDTYYNRLPIGNPTFDTTSVIGKMKPTPIFSVAQDVMNMRARRTRSPKTCPNLHSLHRRNTHHRYTQACTQASIPLTEASQANWNPESHHFKDTTARITIALSFQDTRNHLLRQRCISTTHR